MARNGGMMNIIRCDKNEYLVWKWRPESESISRSDSRSIFIRWGSSIRVKDGEIAIFVYRSSDAGEHDIHDVIRGPYDGIICTSNLPAISKIVGLAYGGAEGGPFQAEVYFINLQGNNQILFGIPYFDVFDSRYPDLAVPVSTRGTITFNLTDYEQFIKLNRLRTFDLDDLRNQIKSAVTKYIKHVIINIADTHKISVIRLESKILDINEEAQRYIAERFANDFGINLKALDIEAITLCKDSAGYRQLNNLTIGIVSRTTQAQADANIRNLNQMQEMNSENIRATMAIQREEMQRAQRLQTESTFIGTHALDRQTEVGIHFADSIGNSSSIEGGSSMNPAGIMAGMMMGGALGHQAVNMMNQAGNVTNVSLNRMINQSPELPNVVYYVFSGGQQSGPYKMVELSQQVMKGTLTTDTYVWKSGMTKWEFAKDTELITLFPPAPPAPPSAPTPDFPPFPNDDIK